MGAKCKELNFTYINLDLLSYVFHQGTFCKNNSYLLLIIKIRLGIYVFYERLDHINNILTI